MLNLIFSIFHSHFASVMNFGDDFIGQWQIVHSFPDATLCDVSISVKKRKERVIEEVSRQQSSQLVVNICKCAKALDGQLCLSLRWLHIG